MGSTPDFSGSSRGSSRGSGSGSGPVAGVVGAAGAQSDVTVVSSRLPGEEASVAEIGRSLEGRALGPYQLQQFVGGGGMGAVFRALDTTLDRIVAVKVLSRQQSADEEMLKRFRNEAQSAARLDHENIGRVHAVGSDDGWHYIVFEFIEGTNLRDVVNEGGPFDLARTIDLTIQIADALEHASQRDVVHRDIKPSNIIITPAGRARLVDMGLARLHHLAGDQDLTVSGMTLGTFDYISPEQARDPRSADVRSDLYSLGCTVFFMLVGRPPFADGTMVQKLLQHQQTQPPPIESLRPDVPKRFGGILARLMAKSPEDRYQRPASLIADLLAFADDSGIELAAPRPAVVVPFEPTEHRPAPSVVPWLVPLLGLLGLVVMLWLRSAAVQTPATPSAGRPGVAGDGVAGAGAGRAAAGSGAADGLRAPRRVVDVPAGPGEYASIAEAIRDAVDGDVIELAYSAVHDEPPLAVTGKRLSLRAADGCRPFVRFIEAAGDASRGDPSRVDGPDRVGCTITSGSIDIRGIGLQVASLAGGPGGRTALFELRGPAALACEEVELRMPGETDRGRAGFGDRDVHAGNAFVRIVDAGAETDARRDVRMIRSTAVGDAVFLDASGGGRVDVLWSEGMVVTANRFLLAEGSTPADGQGLSLGLSLTNGLFACREGFACLLDSSARPVMAQVRGFADGCRFLIPDGKSLLEQSGIADPDLYRTAIEWIDAGSRYEGSDVFRRIDGSAERVEMDYAASPQPLIHSSRIDEWPATDGDPGAASREQERERAATSAEFEPAAADFLTGPAAQRSSNSSSGSARLTLDYQGAFDVP